MGCMESCGCTWYCAWPPSHFSTLMAPVLPVLTFIITHQCRSTHSLSLSLSLSRAHTHSSMINLPSHSSAPTEQVEHINYGPVRVSVCLCVCDVFIWHTWIRLGYPEKCWIVIVWEMWRFVWLKNCVENLLSSIPQSSFFSARSKKYVTYVCI